MDLSPKPMLPSQSVPPAHPKSAVTTDAPPPNLGSASGLTDPMEIDPAPDAIRDEYEYCDEEDEHEWEEEEAYYVLDFGKHLTLPELRAAGNQCKILGLDSDNPFVQVGPAVFRGSSMESLGQDIIFAKHPSLHALDEESASKFDDNHPGRYPHLQMLHIMDRRVKMTPVRLRHKPSASKGRVAPPAQLQQQPPQQGQAQASDVASSSARL